MYDDKQKHPTSNPFFFLLIYSMFDTLYFMAYGRSHFAFSEWPMRFVFATADPGLIWIVIGPVICFILLLIVGGGVFVILKKK